MSDFKAKMHTIRFLLGLRTRPRWRCLQRSPRLLLLRGGIGEERGRERKEEGEGMRGRDGRGGMCQKYFGLELPLLLFHYEVLFLLVLGLPRRIRIHRPTNPQSTHLCREHYVQISFCHRVRAICRFAAQGREKRRTKRERAFSGWKQYINSVHQSFSNHLHAAI